MLVPSQLKQLGNVSLSSCKGNRAVFNGDAGEIVVTACHDGIFRLALGDMTLADYGIVVGKEKNLTLAVSEKDDNYLCKAGDYTLALHKSTHAISILNEDDPVLPVTEDSHFNRRFRLPPLAKTADGWFVTLGLPFGVSVYGGGEKYGPLNRRGLLMDLWNEDALGVNSSLSYKNCPFLWSPDGWGVFINTPGHVRLGVGYPEWSNQSLCLDVREERLDLFFIAAPTPSGILYKYTHLTGRSPETPLWSLGLWLSKAYYKTPQETIEAARGMREKGIPCDVITLDGRAWQDTDTRFHFSFDPSRYDNPKAFCDTLKAMHFKICAWEYPLVSVSNPNYAELAARGYFLKDKNGEPFRYNFDMSAFGKVLTPLPQSSLIDFTNPGAYEFWKNEHKKIFELGIDSIKSDFSEQVTAGMYAFNGDEGKRLHNGYTLLYNLCVYEAGREFYGENALNWSRSGWAGSQRAPMQWAGDTGSTWSGLAASIMGGLSWGMSGCPYYSTDIGGFYGEQPGPELFTRWTQAAVFCSHMRYHGIGPREPWAYGAEAEKICREFIELRYKLIPYLQTACAEAAYSGLPVMRSMPLSFPNEPALWSFDLQYMFGNDIFVAPVLQAGGKVRYRLPLGVWRNLWTGDAHDGGVTVNAVMPLDRIPVYVRDGAFIPFGPAVSHTGELNENNRISAYVAYGDVTGVTDTEAPILSPRRFFAALEKTFRVR